MKLAVVKIGARIAVNNNSTSCGTGETVSVISILVGAGFQVDAYTKILDNDDKPINFNIYDIETEYDKINDRGYDALVVLNGNANFFGGAENLLSLLTYNVLNNFKGKVYYILCDPYLIPKQIWKSVEAKPWCNKYKEEDINITRTDINIITQVPDLDAIKTVIEKQIVVNSIQFFPFERFPLYTMKDFDRPKEYECDIMYDGTFRSGRREADMIKFYFGYPEDIRVEMFGKLKLENFKENKYGELVPPMFNKSVKYDEFSKKMNTSIATIAIGDSDYKKLGILGQRIYESVRIGNVIFIDNSYDADKKAFDDPYLKDFSYVEDRNDVIERIRALKKHPNFINEIIERQRKDVTFDAPKYLARLRSLF